LDLLIAVGVRLRSSEAARLRLCIWYEQ
jgi:hypothetical protein